MATTHAITKADSDRFTEVNGVKIHYNEAGEGPAFLCFHGGGPGANAWDNTKHNIDAFAEHFRTLLVDLPAYGESDKSMKLGDTPLDVYWGDIVLGLMDQLGIDKAHLFSSSQSGAMSLRLGIDHPDRIGKIVMQSSGVGGGRLMFQPSPPAGIKALGVFANNPVYENMEKMMELFIPDAKLRTQEMVQARFDAAVRPGHLEARQEFSASKNSDLSGMIGKLQNEVLVVWGHQDAMVPVEGAIRALVQIPNVRVHIWGGAGHFIEYERADEFSRLVIDFLSN
ncbi:MAG: alpha/beta hydrolase [Dehalococcoidia bacterium]